MWFMYIHCNSFMVVCCVVLLVVSLPIIPRSLSMGVDNVIVSWMIYGTIVQDPNLKCDSSASLILLHL